MRSGVPGSWVRKLLMLACGVLRNQQKFDKDWHNNQNKKLLPSLDNTVSADANAKPLGIGSKPDQAAKKETTK